MDIHSRAPFPSGALSNFYPHSFIFDDVQCASMEGLLQSTKFQDVVKQREICQLSGLEAKRAGEGLRDYRRTKLYWNSASLDRLGEEWQDFLDLAYASMFDQAEHFRDALLASGNEVLTHRIGKVDPNFTMLTVDEFCGRLMALRDILKFGVST
ncbi:hypothetical protein RsoM2USA_62 [Ralstonia phage RsoM2USA]|nr:hypothetical protein RsoM2USA_62 [Ralstonia phage RsoM2USA]